MNNAAPVTDLIAGCQCVHTLLEAFLFHVNHYVLHTICTKGRLLLINTVLTTTGSALKMLAVTSTHLRVGELILYKFAYLCQRVSVFFDCFCVTCIDRAKQVARNPPNTAGSPNKPSKHRPRDLGPHPLYELTATTTKRHKLTTRRHTMTTRRGRMTSWMAAISTVDLWARVLS